MGPSAFPGERADALRGVDLVVTALALVGLTVVRRRGELRWFVAGVSSVE